MLLTVQQAEADHSFRFRRRIPVRSIPETTIGRFVPSMTQHSNLKHLQFFGQAQFVNFTELQARDDITF